MVNEKKLKENIEHEIRWLYDQRNYNRSTIELFVAGIRKAVKDSIEDEENQDEV